MVGNLRATLAATLYQDNPAIPHPQFLFSLTGDFIFTSNLIPFSGQIRIRFFFLTRVLFLYSEIIQDGNPPSPNHFSSA